MLGRALIVAAILCAPGAAADWLQAGYDAGHTGDSLQPGPEWDDISYTTRAPGFQGFFAIVNGSAYYRGWATEAGPPFAIWRLELSSNETELIIEKTPAFATGLSDGSRLFLAGEGRVEAYRIPDGSPLWRTELRVASPEADAAFHGNTETECGIPAVEGSTLYLACVYQQSNLQAPNAEIQGAAIVTLRALDTSTGAARWEWTAQQDTSGLPGWVGGGSSVPATTARVHSIGISVIGQWVVGVTAAEVPVPDVAGGSGWYWDGWVLSKEDGEPPPPGEATFPPFAGPSAPRFGRHPSAGIQQFPPSPHVPSIFAGNLDILAFKNDPYPEQTVGASGTDRLLTHFREDDLVRIGDAPIARGAPRDEGSGLVIANGAVYAASGRNLWRTDYGLTVAWNQTLQPGQYFPRGEPIAAGDRLYIKSADATDHATLEARDLRTGDILWTHPFASCCPGVIVSEDLLVTVDYDHVMVFGHTPLSLEPDAKVSTHSPSIGREVQVDLSRTGPGKGGAATSYRADWGDGTISDWGPAPTFSHAYGAAGNPTARFFVKNDAGQTASMLVEFHVRAQPTGWFAAPFDSGNLALTVFLGAVVVASVAGGGGLLLMRRRVAGLHSRFAEVDSAARGAAGREVLVSPGMTVLGKYRVEHALGAGGGGQAFLAKDIRMDRRVVLKVIPGADTESAIREARAAAAIEHPNVVRVFDVEDLGSQALLVMEYVNGGSLKQRLAAGGALSDEAFAGVADDLLSALDAVHAAGAVHRDVKPSNILLTRTGRAKLSDFGIAQLAGIDVTLGAPAVGSVQYMSPEQARGKRMTAQSDLYSAAATLYEARTGQPLVTQLSGESAAEMQMRIASSRAFDKPIQPPALRAWFARALAPVPESRFSSADLMRERLAHALGGR